MGEHRLDRCGSGQGHVGVSCESGNEPMLGISYITENVLAS